MRQKERVPVVAELSGEHRQNVKDASCSRQATVSDRCQERLGRLSAPLIHRSRRLSNISTASYVPSPLHLGGLRCNALYIMRSSCTCVHSI